MKYSSYLDSSQIALRWNVHRTTVLRIFRRYGCSPMKYGASKTSPRRFASDDVLRIEKLARHTP
jgi:hypothetical protein